MISTWDDFVGLDVAGFYDSDAGVNEWLRIAEETFATNVLEEIARQ